MEEIETTEVWTYGGIRVWEPENTKVHCWIPPDGKEVFYQDKIRAADRNCAIGGRYEITVIRREDTTRRKTLPKYLGTIEDAKQRAVLWAAHWAAQTRISDLRQERVDGKKDALAEAIMPLKEIAGAMNSRADRNALIAHVIRELTSVW